MEKISMENEFENMRVQHLRNTIRECLAEFEDIGIYDITPLLKKYKGLKDTSNKSIIVEEDLYYNYYKSNNTEDKKIYENFYEICYELLYNNGNPINNI